MDIIRRILGEADKPDDEPKEKKPKAKTDEPEKPVKEPADDNGPAASTGTPAEAEIDELAHLWTQGNRNDVARRFMGMDNETAVKVVFAIGREGALELARMVDAMLEQQGEQEGVELPPEAGEGPSEGPSTEPASIEPPPDDEGYPTRQILGVQ
jgi:hypothetical protein